MNYIRMSCVLAPGGGCASAAAGAASAGGAGGGGGVLVPGPQRTEPAPGGEEPARPGGAHRHPLLRPGYGTALPVWFWKGGGWWSQNVDLERWLRWTMVFVKPGLGLQGTVDD